jgi:putative DNA methylase
MEILMTRPSVLIENWLPIAEVGVESMRERGASSALPPLYFLHVWWARRPLIASRAAILASVLPQWSADWPADLQQKFPTEQTYHQWFIHLIGITGDPVKGMKIVQWAKDRGIKLNFHPYGGAPRAFTVNPSAEDLKLLGDLLEYTWGSRQISVLDPFAGGGSIPFEALRYGFTTFANDLNPVAATILKATLDYPTRFGLELAEDIRKWGNRWAKESKVKLEPYFPKQPNENIFAYLWARTVQWRERTVPLSPNWWLATGDKPVAVRLVADSDKTEPRFEILEGRQIGKYDPDQGTISRGTARCPWNGETIDGDYIKAEAQAGRMGQVLYVVVLKVKGGFEFRVPSENEISQLKEVEKIVKKNRSTWILKDILPTEAIPEGNKTSEPRRYGEYYWENSFNPRQLLTLVTYAEGLKTLAEEIKKDSKSSSKLEAIITYLAISLDKAVVYNNRHCRFDPSRGIRSVFDRHDFAFVWSHAEFDGSANLLPWVVDQTIDAYTEITKLIAPPQLSVNESVHIRKTENLNIYRGSALAINEIPNNSIANISVDPPYYDNVQYAELADFFYVWLKRSVGYLFPEFFTDELTNKDDEAVANPARFALLGSKKNDLAKEDYERKMAAAFREMHRVLHPDGVLTVMFTHKKVEAWDTLASALIGAGFTIKASWPVHTESEHSLHQAKKNAAASTIMLVCRKRDIQTKEPVWWEDLQAEVRRVAREKAAEYVNQGITGADLYISTFGPTLNVISQNWPVLTSEVDPKTGQPRPLRPEIALDLAREEVVRLRKQGLLAGREVQFDPVTDWYLMAWDAYAAEQFPYDEARKLAIALGVDLDHDLMSIKRLAKKKGEYILMQTPAERRKTGMVDDELTSFTHWIDAAHTAMMIYSEDGAGECDLFLQKSGLKRDTTFKALLQTLINVIPRSRIKGKFVRPEAEVLENMRLAFFSDDLTAPKEDEPELPQEKQMGLWQEENIEIEEEQE